MSFSVTTFKTNLASGSRPNLFNVTITPPTGIQIANHTILCKGAAVPGLTLGVIEVPYRGRRIKLPGDRTFAEWTATFIADQSLNLRAGFETWMATISSNDFGSTNLRTSTNEYRQNIVVDHLKDDGAVSKSYTLKEAFPTDISQIDLSYDTTDTIEEFTVTFQYSYFV
jgi:hypothetical protein